MKNKRMVKNELKAKDVFIEYFKEQQRYADEAIEAIKKCKTFDDLIALHEERRNNKDL